MPVGHQSWSGTRFPGKEWVPWLFWTARWMVRGIVNCSATIYPFLAFEHPDGLELFQGDNALPQHSKVAREWFAEHAGVQRLGWPSQGTYMTIIEHIWDAVKSDSVHWILHPRTGCNWLPPCRRCGVNSLRKCTRDLLTHFHTVSLRSVLHQILGKYSMSFDMSVYINITSKMQFL